MMKTLSLIIPAYNAEPYLGELLDRIAPQMTDEVEVIVVDDGSDPKVQPKYDWVRLIRQDNKGVSIARNVGIDNADGEYIAFIDADDLISENYFSIILDKIHSEKFDYCYLSWKSFGNGIRAEVKVQNIDYKFPIWNRCVWNKVYAKSFIGDVRFNPKKSMAEDAEFIREIKEERGKKSFVSEFVYFYRNDTPNSLTRRFNQGLLNDRRVVYYFPIITQKMTFLVDEIKELSTVAEVMIMTNTNQLPQLEQYALVIHPHKIKGTELRGYPTNLFTKVSVPIKTDIVIWTERTNQIGGIETFNYNFCKQLSPYYDITVMYRVIDPKQRARLSDYARVVHEDEAGVIECNTLIVNRITDGNPKQVKFKKKVQMVHSCKWRADLQTPKDNDYLIPVSDVVAKTYPDFKKDYRVIHNMTVPKEVGKALILVSATRTSTNEKGQKRMIALSNLMKKRGIPFIWLCFCDIPLTNAPNITFLKPTLDISPYIKSADYLVQLSDHEGFCYSIVEAMELGTPILVTDLAVLPELGFKDGVNGYKIPWEITDNFDVRKIYEHQLKGTFEYKFDNDKCIEQWQEVLGQGHPVHKYNAKEATLKLRVTLTFDDMKTQERLNKGRIIERNALRAYDLMQKKFVVLDESEMYDE